jgi:GxxExxY protein
VNDKQIKDPKTYEIIAAAMEVHRILGPGFLEGVYHEAMCIECTLKSTLFQKEVELPVVYKGRLLAAKYRADVVCFNDFLVEIKALSQLTTKEDAQVINYLKATGLRTGLLLNFGTKSLEFKRFVLTGKTVLPLSESD